MHNISGEMFYSFKEPAWHNIRKPSQVQKRALEILADEMGGGLSVDCRAATIWLNGKSQELKQFFIVRSPVAGVDTEEYAYDGSVSERFNPLQPREICEAFDTHVREYVETMAFLGGKKCTDMFISWKLDKSIFPKPDDKLDLFGIIRAGWDGLHAASLFTSVYRPVCNNTVTLAQNWAEKNTDRANKKGMLWKGRAVNPNLLRDLGYWMEHVQSNITREADLLEQFFGKLAKTPVTSDLQAQELIGEAFPLIGDYSELWPAQLREDKSARIQAHNETQMDIRNGIFKNWAEQDGINVTADFYGLVNATTAFVCHDWPSKRPIAESVMFGPRADVSMQMIKTLSNQMK